MKEFYPNLGTSPSKVTWGGVIGGQDAMEKEGLNSQFCIGSLSVRMILIISGVEFGLYIITMVRQLIYSQDRRQTKI
jgi:hypothetical protein